MPRDTRIADRLRARGLRTVEIDGWRERGKESFNPAGSVDHHTAGAASGNAPSLGVCINGRPGIPGPLCLESGTAILTARGFASIEDVRVGDQVWTHVGRWRPVIATMARLAETVRVRAPGVAIRCTPDHRWLSRHGTWVPTTRLTNMVQASSGLPTMRAPAIDGFTATADLLRVCGLWVAEGSVSRARPMGRGPLVLTINRTEEPTVGKWLTLAGLDWWTSGYRAGTATLKIRSHVLAEWVVEHFGVNAHGKTVPAWLLSNEELGRAFLDGYLFGDGHEVAGNSRTRAHNRFSSVSRRLAVGVVLLARSIGMYAYIADRRQGRAGRLINGQLTKTSREFWTGDVYDTPPAAAQRFHRRGSDLNTKVTRVEPGRHELVYDFEVEDDHSFLADGIWSHNCHVLVARDNTCYVIAAGRANHAGEGGWKHLRGNSSVFGVERENRGTSAEPWRSDQTEVAVQVHTALIEGLSVPRPELVCGHKEWAPGRKTDPHSLDMPDFRRRVTAALVEGGDPLAGYTEAQLRKMMREEADAAVLAHLPSWSGGSGPTILHPGETIKFRMLPGSALWLVGGTTVESAWVEPDGSASLVSSPVPASGLGAVIPAGKIGAAVRVPLGSELVSVQVFPKAEE